MRPIKMRLKAFGPFPDTQTVDFRTALGARLFGIYGPTGAGKTSILDGICFALFGESSGQERHGDDLRSHHATPDLEMRKCKRTAGKHMRQCAPRLCERALARARARKRAPDTQRPRARARARLGRPLRRDRH